MTVRLIIRGFRGKVAQFVNQVEVEEQDMDRVLPALAEKHATDMASGKLTMIEIELVDQPDPNQRFIRIGTDPSLMIEPWELKP